MTRQPFCIQDSYILNVSSTRNRQNYLVLTSKWKIWKKLGFIKKYKKKIVNSDLNIYTYHNEIEIDYLKFYTVKPNEQKFRGTWMFIIIKKQ